MDLSSTSITDQAHTDAFGLGNTPLGTEAHTNAAPEESFAPVAVDAHTSEAPIETTLVPKESPTTPGFAYANTDATRSDEVFVSERPSFPPVAEATTAAPSPVQAAPRLTTPNPRASASFTSGSASQSHPMPPPMPPPGPAGFISWREIDPEKLKPFIGPLLPQQPPPNKPLPLPPSTSEQRRRENSVQSNLAGNKTTMDEDDSFSLGPPSEDMPEAKTPAKQRLGNTSDTVEDGSVFKSVEKSIKTKHRSLRNKVSTLFGEQAAPQTPGASNTSTSTSTYRPLSLNSHQSDSISFSDIFDNIVSAARTSTASGRLSMSTLSREANTNAPAPTQAMIEPINVQRHSSAPEASETVAHRLAGRVDQATLADLLAASNEAPPPLTEHPAVRGDLSLQARLGLLDVNANPSSVTGTMPARSTAFPWTSGLRVAPLNVGRQRPTQVAVATRHASRSTVASVEPLEGHTTRYVMNATDAARGRQLEEDVDPDPAFDRTVDVVWYRHTNRVGESIRLGYVPNPAKIFEHVSDVFMIKHSRGQETTKYDELGGRFRYFDLDADIRFNIMKKLLEDYLPGKPILLGFKSQASPAWPADNFATLKEVLDPLQAFIRACPRLRADVMTALLMIQPFHVIFTPYVRPAGHPLATKWLFDYVYFMQDLRVEVDMTKQGFRSEWEATGLSVQLQVLGDHVHSLVERLLKRCPRSNPIASLTIHCRRHFGYRQGENPYDGDEDFYKHPLVGVQDQAKASHARKGQPWNRGVKSASLPPSANNPYSGHRRHHGYARDRVPFVHEGHMSVFNPFLKLAGRVWIVRMAGLSESWVSENRMKFWTQAESDAIPDKAKMVHADRYTPSRHAYAAPGYAVYLDYGLRSGIHRFPPLPNSEPMVCAEYDPENDMFIEVGSGNVLGVVENGVEVIARARYPPVPIRDLPVPGGPAVPIDTFNILRPSKIPMTTSGATSPVLEAAKKGYPSKALRLLGLSGDPAATPAASPTEQDPDEDEEPVTPTMPPRTRVSVEQEPFIRRATMEDDRVGELAPARTPKTASRSKALATKKSFLGLMGSDRRNPTV